MKAHTGISVGHNLMLTMPKTNMVTEYSKPIAEGH